MTMLRILLILFLAYVLWKVLAPQVLPFLRRGPRQRSEILPDDDPYAVLGVPRSASLEEIAKAFHDLAAKYHPDKVAHLGEDLQHLANERFLAIERAYSTIKRNHPQSGEQR